MALRFRKSIKLGPGVRLNVGKKSLGLSSGVKGMRYSVNTSGRATRSVGIPGTGLSSVTSSKIGAGSKARQPAKAQTSPPQPRAVLPKPSMFAPAFEKRFYEGVQAYLAGDLQKALASFEAASSGDERNASDDLFAGVAAQKLGDSAKAIGYLERVVESSVELPDQLMAKYLPAAIAEISLSVSITPLVSASVAANSLGACLLLSELYQEAGRLEEAIGLLQQLSVDAPDDVAIKVALCDLLFEDGDHDGVLDSSSAFENESDLALAGLLLRGKSLAAKGLNDAALAVFTSSLKKTSGRERRLLTELRYERACVAAAAGKAAQSKRDFEKVFAEDPGFRDVASRLSAASENSPPPSPGEVSALGDKLRELASLRDEGLITAEEFEAKRKALVDA